MHDQGLFRDAYPRFWICFGNWSPFSAPNLIESPVIVDINPTKYELTAHKRKTASDVQHVIRWKKDFQE